jgi:hypothetical protein
MILNSKILEEVKKRRGKPSPVNNYQKLVLLAGAAGLVFAIWTSPASMLAVGVMGTTLLIFLVLKDSKEKQDKGKKVDPKETHSEVKENVDLREMLPEGKENVDLREMVPEGKENVNLREMVPEGKENVNLQEMLSGPEEKERAEKVV